jgi:hypothetical protein
MRTLSAVLLSLALGATVPAQALSMHAAGKLLPAPSTCCDASATHVFQFGDLRLRSSTLDLARFVNHYVDLVGTPTIVANCGITLDVTEIQDATAKLTMISFSNYRIGSSLSLLTQAPVGALAVQLFAAGPGLVPALQLGTLFLDPAATQQWAIDLGIGLPYPRIMTIPNNPALVGLQPQFQALVIDSGNLLGTQLTNAVGCTLRG